MFKKYQGWILTEKYIKTNNLSVSEKLINFINNDVLPGTSIEKSFFWDQFDRAVHELTIQNKLLLQERRRLQLEIDRLHLNNMKFF